MIHYGDHRLWTATSPCELNNIPTPEEISLMIATALGHGVTTVAANQVGDGRRFFLGRLDNDWELFVNPEIRILDIDNYLLIVEKCPHSEVACAMKRYLQIELEWTNFHGERCSSVFTGMAAADAQAAINFLDGNDYGRLHKLGDWGAPHYRYAG